MMCVLWVTFIVAMLLFVVTPFTLRFLALCWVTSQQKQDRRSASHLIRKPRLLQSDNLNENVDFMETRHVLVVITSTDVRLEHDTILYVRPVVNICSSTLSGGLSTVTSVTATQFATMWNQQMVVTPGGTLVLPVAEGGGQKTDVVVSAMHVTTATVTDSQTVGVETLCMCGGGYIKENDSSSEFPKNSVRSSEFPKKSVSSSPRLSQSDNLNSHLSHNGQPGFFTCVTDQITGRGNMSTPEQLLLWSRRLGCLQRLQRHLLWSFADWWLVARR